MKINEEARKQGKKHQREREREEGSRKRGEGGEKEREITFSIGVDGFYV